MKKLLLLAMLFIIFEITEVQGKFPCRQRPTVKSWRLPYNTSKKYTGKVVKGFNHLRKLCGVPEPISFD
ncbi:hypothetical protein HCX49_19680 [Sphingobacterium kitahiroshimense]|uniref:hypothetical protein n=1 Tax=Sphingobacterium sp. B16(2022) TaxID=2914044 RepID=UPI001439EE3C|nr:hypothetical protein [Sphingobacterium sp. B16(2022)]NJI75431.1 hypothetical protein [Sphingobacterium sp. B16(2022)]